MMRAIGAGLAILIGLVLVTGGSPAGAVVTNAQITAVGTDGTRIPIKSLRVTRGDTGLVSTTPDQDKDDDDRGGAALVFDTDEDRSEEEVTVSGVFVDPETGREYEGSYTTTVPVGGSVDVTFNIDRATGSVTGETTGSRTALELGRPGPAVAVHDPGITLLGSALTFGVDHMRRGQWQRDAGVGDFDGWSIDFADDETIWEARTAFALGLTPWLESPGVAPAGYFGNVGFEATDGSADAKFGRDLSGVEDRVIYPLSDGDEFNVDQFLTVDRDVSISALGGGVSFGYLYRLSHGIAGGPYGSLNFRRNETHIQTNFLSTTIATGSNRRGFFRESVDTNEFSFNVGANFMFPVYDRLFFGVGGSVGGTFMDTDYEGDSCASNDADIACGRGNTAFFEEDVDADSSGIGFNSFGHAGFYYYCGPILFSFSGGGGTSPVTDIDYPNAVGDQVDVGMENENFWKIGIAAQVNLGRLFAAF